jgi:alkylhydroperoxidase/carboxymuconolactone decarboxylase family protein
LFVDIINYIPNSHKKLAKNEIFICFRLLNWLDLTKTVRMSKSYYIEEDLKKFGKVREFQKELGDKFFDWYNAVFKEGALSKREKALIALAVSHAVQCPYCIDAYTKGSLENGADEEQMMEAVHIASAIKGGATLVHGVQMMNKTKEITM